MSDLVWDSPVFQQTETFRRRHACFWHLVGEDEAWVLAAFLVGILEEAGQKGIGVCAVAESESVVIE
jgi:hypothetical protein